MFSCRVINLYVIENFPAAIFEHSTVSRMEKSVCVMLFATTSDGKLGGWSLRMDVYTISGERVTREHKPS